MKGAHTCNKYRVTCALQGVGYGVEVGAARREPPRVAPAASPMSRVTCHIAAARDSLLDAQNTALAGGLRGMRGLQVSCDHVVWHAPQDACTAM